MSVVTTQQIVEVSDISDVKVTEIVSVGGMYIRAIRIYGLPAGENAPLLFELRIKSGSSAPLNVTTPVFEF